MSIDEAVHYDYVFEGQRFRTLRQFEYADHIERVRAYRREHGYPPPDLERGAYRWLGPYEPCERCGVPIVGAEHRAPDGIVTRNMLELDRVRVLVDPWSPRGRAGLVVASIHDCVR